MPKATDIVGTIRVPEEHYGRFWNFMKSMPTAEFTPALQAEAPTKRVQGKTSEGSSMKCIVLLALKASRNSLSTHDLTGLIVSAGKSSKSVGNVLHELQKLKHIRKTADSGWTITAAGTKFCDTSCPVK